VDLVVVSGTLDQVIERAREAYPREGCGLIAGIRPSLVGVRLIPITNIADSASEFEMDPAELIRTLRDLREAGEELVAIYHSHPHGPARPSTVDVRRAHYPEAAHLIVSLADPECARVAGFRIIDGEVIDIEVRAIV